MREITQEEINAKLEAHKLWLDTAMKQGKRAIFSNALIINKNFFTQNLHDVLFENVECVNTEFDHAYLSWTRFYNVSFSNVSFYRAIMNCTDVIQCNISDSNFAYADLKNANFERTTLDNVDFTCSNLHGVNFSSTNIEKIRVPQTSPRKIIGQKIICVQVNTSRENNLISYWTDLGIWTTGCFQGTLEELREAVAKTHKYNPFLRDRYERAINYILEEDRADKENRKEK